jgi:uncharacterized membrane protein YedE/YeeE
MKWRLALACRLLLSLDVQSSWILGLAGGAMIGVASALLLLTHGRIAGVSGIVGGAVHSDRSERAWRLAFLGGLLTAGLVASMIAPHAVGAPIHSPVIVLIAGLLVGFGTQLGSGCTSGHGVCGISRFAPRSLAAVATFMLTGAITAMTVGRFAS